MTPGDPFPVGPIVVPVRAVEVGPGRVEADALAPPPNPIRGVGRWLGLPAGTDAARFRRTFDLAHDVAHDLANDPSDAVVRITADVSYHLAVNDMLVARGPSDVGRDYDIGPTGPWLVDSVAIGAWLRPGPNVLEVPLLARPLVGSEGTLGRPGVWLEADLGDQTINTGSDWEVRPDDGFRWETARAGEPLADQGPIPTLAGAGGLAGDRVAWKPAEPAPDAERPLERSEIPAPAEATYPATGFEPGHGVEGQGLPIRIVRDGRFRVRFDRVLSAHLQATVAGGEGATLTFRPAEAGAGGHHRALRIRPGAGVATFEAPFLDSFSFIDVEATGVTAPFEVRDVRAVFRSQPVRYRGRFACDDPALNQIWAAGRWCTQLCLQTHHLDSPHHQEPISDAGDYLIESLIAYVAFGEDALAAQDLRKVAQIIRDRDARVFHTSYALLWLQMLVAYHEHTGDGALLRELAPTVDRLMEVWESWRGPEGLVSRPPKFMFVDWVEIEGFTLHHPPAVLGQGVFTAFYHRALADQARIAGWLGDPERVRRAEALRAEVRTAFVRELWSPERGRFRDGRPGWGPPPGPWLPEDRDIETFSSQVNLLAAAYGLIGGDDGARLVDEVMATGPADCQPYFLHFAFDALAATGRFDAWATRLMRRWRIEEETRTFREMWGQGDYSHAWQCTPTYQLSSRVLGVRPLAPGYRRVLVQPHPGDLAWAEGAVPTPFGDVEVAWSCDGGRFDLDLTVPEGTSAVVRRPDGHAGEVGPGRHRFAAPG